jgi:hypothetical protein
MTTMCVMNLWLHYCDLYEKSEIENGIGSAKLKTALHLRATFATYWTSAACGILAVLVSIVLLLIASVLVFNFCLYLVGLPHLHYF